MSDINRTPAVRHTEGIITAAAHSPRLPNALTSLVLACLPLALGCARAEAQETRAVAKTRKPPSHGLG